MGCREQPTHRRRRRRRPFFSLVARGFASPAQQAILTGSASEYRGKKSNSCTFDRGTCRSNPLHARGMLSTSMIGLFGNNLIMLVESIPRASDQFGQSVP